MRERYCTKADTLHEDRIGQQCAANWMLSYRAVAANENAYDAEFLYKSTLRVIAEFKRRNFKFGQYPDVVLSADKVRRVMALKPYNVRALFVIEDKLGAIYWTDLAIASLLTPRLGGRTLNTRDPWDIEDVVHIPNACFRPVAVSPCA